MLIYIIALASNITVIYLAAKNIELKNELRQVYKEYLIPKVPDDKHVNRSIDYEDD